MKILLFLLFSTNLLTTALTTTAQKSKSVNTNDFIQECMKNSGELLNKQVVIWMPTDFWQIIGEQMKMPPETINIIVTEMGKYMMFCVVDYSLTNNQMIFKTDEQIRPTLKLVDSAKMIYLPLADKDISPTALQLIDHLKPTMAQLLGQFGAGMRMYLFDAKKTANNTTSFDITKPNRFLLTWDQVSEHWTLPFASVLPPKFCPIDNEPMKGNWTYCPFHGAKLKG